MSLDDYRASFVIATLVLAFVAASPTLGLVLHLPSGERFSELWLLGPGHMAEGYPFNVRADESYMVYLGVENHMGYSAYYNVYVKFRNQTELLPNSTKETSSTLEPLFEKSLIVRDGERWEMPMYFSFSNVSDSENTLFVKALTVNGVSFELNKMASWDCNSTGYFYQLFIELWIYNSTAEGLQYHNRFVGLWLNVTAT